MPSDRDSYKRISLAQRSSLQNPSENFGFIERELLLDQFKNQIAQNYKDDKKNVGHMDNLKNPLLHGHEHHDYQNRAITKDFPENSANKN